MYSGNGQRTGGSSTLKNDKRFVATTQVKFSFVVVANIAPPKSLTSFDSVKDALTEPMLFMNSVGMWELKSLNTVVAICVHRQVTTSIC